MEAVSRWDLSRGRELALTRRSPTESVLYRVLYHLREDLEGQWDDRYAATHGVLRKEVLAALDDYLNCGILIHGCARAVCEKCHHSELIPLSCKKRGVCPSCDAKRAHIFAEHLHENVLLPYPHVHQVFTLPKRVRPFYRFNRRLTGHIYTAAWESWSEYVADELPGCRTGSVMALHTAGSTLNFHPHAHALSLLGGIDDKGTFHELPAVDTEKLATLFADKIYAALLKEGLLTSDEIESLKRWPHSGFNVFSGDPIQPTDGDSRRFVGRYLKKSPISLSRLELIEDGDVHKVRISSSTDDAPEIRTLDPLDFLAELKLQVPLKWEQTTRFFGCYSARARGAERRKKALAEKKPDEPLKVEPPRKPSKDWATWMKKVYLADPLICSNCGSAMRIKAFIRNQKEIERIAKNLGIPTWRAPPPIRITPFMPHAA